MTLLIKNVKVLGGDKKVLPIGQTGLPAGRQVPESSDVFINGDRISAIGNFPNKKADEVIDGQGAYLAPGFINVNTDSDHYLSLFEYPSQEDFLRQGVTTIIGGMCGSSLAPLIYGSLESIRKWADTSRFNVNWRTVGEFLYNLNTRKLGVNFATLIGHSTVRRAIVGEKIRDLTKNELQVLNATVERGLKEGGFGLSTGLGYVHSNKTPYAELKSLAKIVKNYNGVYATHLRKNGAELHESIDETIRLAEDSGVKTTISHFMPLRGAEIEYKKALEKIGSLPADLDFNFDVYPFDESVVTLYSLLPSWAQNGNLEIMASSIKDTWMQTKIEKELPKIDPNDVTVAQAPGNEFLVGKSLKDLSKIYGLKDAKSALLKLMLITELKCVIFYKNIASDLIIDALKHPRSLIATNSASFADSDSLLKQERTTSTFTKFLELVNDQKIMVLEDAIKKITLVPAKKFGLKGRGTVAEGGVADLVLFKDSTIHTVVVNGVISMKEGVFQGKLAGHALKRN